MPEPAARQHLHEPHEKAAAEREPGAVTPPLGDKRMAEIQRLREAMVLPVGMAVGWAIDELVAEVERLRYREKVLDRRNAESVRDCRDIEDENDRLITELSAANAEVERYRGLDAAAKELLARNVELGTSADNAEAKCEDLEDEVARLRALMAKAAALLGRFVNHEDDPCRFDHHGACQEHGGSSLRRCDVAVGRELLARIRGGDNA